MKINIRGANMKITPAIQKYAEEKLSKVDKFLQNPDNIEAQVLMKVEKIGQKVEVTIPLKGAILRAEEVQEDVYAALDIVTDKLERQLRKNKTKIKDQKRRKKKTINYDFYSELEKEEKEEKDESKIVKKKKIETSLMYDEEAIIQMELLGHNFFVYKDVNTMNEKIVYKRKDGNYGTIDIL